MKYHQSTHKVCRAIAGAAVLTATAQAALVNYNAGDLLLGFRDITGTKSIVVNVGSAASFRDDTVGYTATSPVTLSLGDINTDMVAIFGSGWATNPNMRWGIAGSPSNTDTVGGDLANTIYASKAESTNGELESGFLLGNNSRSIASTTMIGMEGSTNGFSTYQASINNPNLVIQDTADVSDWASFQPGGSLSSASTAFKQLNGGIEGNLSQTLDLFRMSSANSSTYLGSFSLGSGGAVAVVPEPSSLLVSCLGVGLLAMRRRRP